MFARTAKQPKTIATFVFGQRPLVLAHGRVSLDIRAECSERRSMFLNIVHSYCRFSLINHETTQLVGFRQ